MADNDQRFTKVAPASRHVDDGRPASGQDRIETRARSWGDFVRPQVIGRFAVAEVGAGCRWYGVA